MNVCLLDRTTSIVELLRADATQRVAPDSLAATLRSWLHDGIEDLRRGGERTPLVLRSRHLTADSVVDFRGGPFAVIRGILITYVLRLACTATPIDDAFANALAAWRSAEPANELVATLAHSDAEELARLAADVNAHASTLLASLGDLQPSWPLRTNCRSSVPLLAPWVVLRDVVDLQLGLSTSPLRSVALLDVTTAPLTDSDERTLHYHALVETLRSGVAPFRVATFSSATGELVMRDVDDNYLVTGLHEVLDAIARQWATP